MRFSSPCLALLAALAAMAAAAPDARAEVFVLRSGGRIEGELLNPDQSPRTTYAVRTAEGVQLTFDASLVEQKLYKRDAELEYDRIKPSFSDTIDGQWALAEWCLNHHLLSQRKTHLERIIQLDPDHAEARRGLGYSQVGGQWKTQKEIMVARGFEWHRGQWRLPQEIDLMERKDEVEKAEREWFAKVKMWRGWLGTNKEAQALKNFAAVNDPAAVRALAAALESEPAEAVRKLYIEVLARINTPDAVKALALRSLEDPVQEVRLTCLDYLKTEKRPDVVALYAARLKSKDNRMVRRAAVGLAFMKDPSSVGPLINALETTHTFRVSSGGGANTFSNTFGTGPGGSGAPGGGGFSFGGGPKTVKRLIRNQEVLDALSSITGVNYQFNVAAWKNWFAQQRKPQAAIDARRD